MDGIRTIQTQRNNSNIPGNNQNQSNRYFPYSMV
jgi:hypothetical protein